MLVQKEYFNNYTVCIALLGYSVIEVYVSEDIGFVKESCFLAL